MMVRLMDNPIPSPAGFVVKNASNIRGIDSALIPLPASRMDTVIFSISKILRDWRNKSFRFGGRHRFDSVQNQIHDDLLQAGYDRPAPAEHCCERSQRES